MSFEISISAEVLGVFGLGVGTGFSIGMYLQRQRHASQKRDEKVSDLEKQMRSLYSILTKMEPNKLGSVMNEALSKDPKLVDKILDYSTEKENA